MPYHSRTAAEKMKDMTEFSPIERDYLPAAGHDHLLPFYDALTRFLGVGRIHRELIDHADMTAGQRVLEIGAGTGNHAALAKRRLPSIALTATAPDPRALRRARRKARGVTFERAWAEDLPYGDASFDRVLSALMLHHLDDEVKRTALGETRRVLAPGGTLTLADFTGDGHGFAGHKPMRDAAFASDVPALMREAGFTEAEELGRRGSRFGTVGYWRGVH